MPENTYFSYFISCEEEEVETVLLWLYQGFPTLGVKLADAWNPIYFYGQNPAGNKFHMCERAATLWVLLSCYHLFTCLVAHPGGQPIFSNNRLHYKRGKCLCGHFYTVAQASRILDYGPLKSQHACSAIGIFLWQSKSGNCMYSLILPTPLLPHNFS